MAQRFGFIVRFDLMSELTGYIRPVQGFIRNYWWCGDLVRSSRDLLFPIDMANRSYLYSLSNRPISFSDRPETISGLSEWAYNVPFVYRALMSGDPQLCGSLVTDGLSGDEPGHPTVIHAISSRFDLGFDRVQRFAQIVQASLAEHSPSPEPQATLAVQPISLLGRLKAIVFPRREIAPTSSKAAPVAATQLPTWLDKTLAFLEAHRDHYLLLETVELDTMSYEEEAALLTCVEQEIARCLHVGVAIDALPNDIVEAGRQLKKAVAQKCEAPLDAFFGLRLDDDCDSTRTGATEHPLGLQWSEVLYFNLSNRAEREARQG